jgi:hypothetical protein
MCARQGLNLQPTGQNPSLNPFELRARFSWSVRYAAKQCLTDLFIFTRKPIERKKNLHLSISHSETIFLSNTLLSVFSLTRPIGGVLWAHMTTPATTDKPEKQAAATPSARTRSPAYPAFNLQTSLDRAKAVWQHEARNPAPMASLAAAWGTNLKSSTTLLTVASLTKFGLLEDVDTGKERLLKLTQTALNIILNDQEDSSERIGLLKQCALTPKIHADLWKQYNGELPSDTSLKRHLIVEKNFNATSVDGFIKQFRDTISFAKLSHSDKITITETEDSEKEETMKPTRTLEPNVVQMSGGFVGKSTLTAVPLVLREFTVPLSAGTISLRIPSPIDEDDFQLFLDTLNLWKRQLIKKPAAKTSEEILQEIEKRHKSWPKPPFAAMWKNKHCDTMVEIVGEMGEKDGVKFYQSKDGTGIPAHELFPGIKQG